MKLGQLTVRAKLATGFGSVAAMVALVSVLSLQSLEDSNDRFASYVEGINARVDLATRMRAAVDQRAIAARNLVLVSAEDDVNLEKKEVAQADQNVQDALRQLNDMMSGATDATPEAKSRVAEINRIEQAYGPVTHAIVDAALNDRHFEAIAAINDKCRPMLRALGKATDDYVHYNRTLANELVQQGAQRYAVQRALLLAICGVALAVAVAAGGLITRGLLRTLGAEPAELSAVTRRIASGDLRSIDGTAHAPRGSVLASMGEMQASLVALIEKVRTSADTISSGSSQIAAGNADLSTRTEQQAASLQQTASSMEQLTSTVKLNAENAQQASSLAANASGVSQHASAVVGQVADTMSAISQSSTRIADIIGLIEGIAFQTNILALNAAVEAARAGEQGRGFAVVAGEVRSLAQRASNAAKEIKDLITASVRKIHDGSTLADEAGQTMADVTQAVARVTGIMGEIAAASQEQSRGIEHVSIAITQMDEVTQQNAALVEEAAAASRSLEQQGKQLEQAVSLFQLARSDVGHHKVGLPNQIAKTVRL